MAAYKAPPEKKRFKNYANVGYTFANGGMPMAPPMPPAPQGDPGQMIQQKMAAVPKAQQGKVKKVLAEQLKKAVRAKQQAPAMPMPPPGQNPAVGAPMPPPGMKKGGTVKKAIGGSVRGVGIARKGGGRGRIV